MNQTNLNTLASRLSDLDKSLLLGTADGWGSWMFTSGSYMVSLGLGRKCGGSITFDTPLARELIDHLRAISSMENTK